MRARLCGFAILAVLAASLVPQGRARPAAEVWWSVRPLHAPAGPVISNLQCAIRNPIDAFVRAKLQAEGLPPTGFADKRTLIRRVTFDLIGLPPTPQEVEAFVTDPAPDAYERLVDRLLASPHYGERWARHWMD